MNQPVPGAHSPLSVLVVEDDKVTRELLGILIAAKFPEVTIHSAVDGKAGLQLFEQHMPFIVITDINMPVMDGIQMAREIRARKGDTNLIALTAYSDRGYEEKFREVGFNAFMLKPVVFDKLFKAIEECLQRA